MKKARKHNYFSFSSNSFKIHVMRIIIKNIEELNAKIKSEQCYDKDEIKASTDNIIERYKKEIERKKLCTKNIL